MEHMEAPPVAIFSHQDSSGMWHRYSDYECHAISQAMAQRPGGGQLKLSTGPFEIRWGELATSAKMPTPPATRIIQVNTATQNTRIVRGEGSSMVQAVGAGMMQAVPGLMQVPARFAPSRETVLLISRNAVVVGCACAILIGLYLLVTAIGVAKIAGYVVILTSAIMYVPRGRDLLAPGTPMFPDEAPLLDAVSPKPGVGFSLLWRSVGANGYVISTMKILAVLNAARPFVFLSLAHTTAGAGLLLGHMGSVAGQTNQPRTAPY